MCVWRVERGSEGRERKTERRERDANKAEWQQFLAPVAYVHQLVLTHSSPGRHPGASRILATVNSLQSVMLLISDHMLHVKVPVRSSWDKI